MTHALRSGQQFNHFMGSAIEISTRITGHAAPKN